MKKYVTALTIAGFDGSGGAGIQADLKTFAALGCYGMSVLTSLPVQNTQGVRNIYDISTKCIQEQCDAIFEDIQVDVVKIGMLHRTDIIETVAQALIKYKPKHIVVDPVMVAKSGDRLLKLQAVDALIKHIFPLATIITPNIPEAQDLWVASKHGSNQNKQINSEDEIKLAGRELLSLGPKNVIIKGGHQTSGPEPSVDGISPTTHSCDYLFTQNGLKPSAGGKYRFSSPRINTKNTHGTGCTFSAAIAAYLGHGHTIQSAIENAKNYLTKALASGAEYQTGLGNGPVHHNFDTSVPQILNKHQLKF